MSLFGCDACKAKDDEIVWLRHELEVARRTMVEALKPGTTKVVEKAETKPVEHFDRQERPKKEPTFPGYEPTEPHEFEVT